MRLFYLFILSLSFFLAQVVSASSADCVIVAKLRMGSGGGEVQCLQKKVGAVADGHFGPLTKASVIIFQTKNGLSPDGVVGPLTRAVLNPVVAKNDIDLAISNNNLPKSSEIVKNSVENINPNLKNIDTYIAAVKRGALKGGLSSDKLPLLEDKIRRQAEISPNNYRKQFFDLQKDIYGKKISEMINKAPALGLFGKVFSFFDETFSIKKALAVGLSFGGIVSYINPEICDCPSGVFTQLYVESPVMSPPVSNILLDYLNGSQGFSAYNLPEASVYILGLYKPSVPSCWTYIGESCVLIESEGLIQPMVGSSLE